MKTSAIKYEANKVINTIFIKLLDNENKDDWKKAFNFIESKINILENGARGEEMFIWRKVKGLLNTKYGNKFISIK